MLRFFGTFLAIFIFTSFFFAHPSLAQQPSDPECNQVQFSTVYAQGTVINSTNPSITVDDFLSQLRDFATSQFHCRIRDLDVSNLRSLYDGLHPSPTPSIVVQGNTVSPVPNDQNCGKYSDPPSQCCLGQADTNFSCTRDDPDYPNCKNVNNDVLCVELPLIPKICLEGLIRTVGNGIGSIIQTGDLNKLGSCRNDQYTDQGVLVHLQPNYESGQCLCKTTETPEVLSGGLCKYIATSQEARGVSEADALRSREYMSCKQCIVGHGHWSAFLCIHSDSWKSFIEQNLLGLGVSFGSLAAFLCMIYAAFILQTSAGNPEKIKNAQQMLTSCIMGLILIIFSVFILRLIGVTILHIPGLG